MIWVGIDPGTHTGIAVWDGRAFREVTSMPLHEALLHVRSYAAEASEAVTVVYEDARLRRWYGTATAREDRNRLQGAGSVKRDCAIWEEALSDWGIAYKTVAPKNNTTKMSAEAFRRLTGWQGKTNEHGRDAAMLVFGR